MQKTMVTLEQWQILSAIEEQGSYQAAADHLGKSQSSISYMMQKMQEGLGVKLFATVGRRAELTDAGHTILRRARHLLNEAQQLEHDSKDLAEGWEAELTVVVDMLIPQPLIMETLERFAPLSRGTRLDVFNTSLSGTEDFIIQGQADIGFIARTPIGFLGEKLCSVEFVPVASPNHPLSESREAVSEEAMKQHRQIVVRDSGARRRLDAGWLGAEQRWTVSNFQQSVEYVKNGLGFAFLPQHVVTDSLNDGSLQQFELANTTDRKVDCHMVFPKRFGPGPCASLLAETMRDVARLYNHQNTNR